MSLIPFNYILNAVIDYVNVLVFWCKDCSHAKLLVIFVVMFDMSWPLVATISQKSAGNVIHSVVSSMGIYPFLMDRSCSANFPAEASFIKCTRILVFKLSF